MEALQFRHEIARYLVSRATYAGARRWWSARRSPLHHVDIDPPTAKAAGWAALRVRVAGICGTDLRLVTGEDSLYLEPEASYPFVPGHELVGDVEDPTVIEPARRTDAGTGRVVVWPVLGCRVRDRSEPCPACATGWEGLCEARDDSWPGVGCAIGFSRETGGGWSETCLAHASQLWPLPDSVTDEDAVLLDPAATALAALLRPTGPPPERTLVIGGGTIGLLTAYLHSALGLPGECELMVHHGFQRGWPEGRGLATAAVRTEGEFRAWASGQKMASQRVSGYGYVYRGVYDRVIDCAGTRHSLTRAMHVLRPRGQLVLVSAPFSLRGVDPTPIWYREITCRGVYSYGPVPWGGEWRHPFEVLIPRLADGTLRFGGLVTHRFALADYVSAINAAVHRRSSGAIKVVFTPTRRASR